MRSMESELHSYVKWLRTAMPRVPKSSEYQTVQSYHIFIGWCDSDGGDCQSIHLRNRLVSPRCTRRRCLMQGGVEHSTVLCAPAILETGVSLHVLATILFCEMSFVIVLN